MNQVNEWKQAAKDVGNDMDSCLLQFIAVVLITIIVFGFIIIIASLK